MRKDAWSKENIEYLENNYHRMTCVEIGRVVKKSRSAVSGMASRLKLTKKERNNDTSKRNTKNTVRPFTGYLGSKKSYREIEHGGREELETPLRYAVS